VALKWVAMRENITGGRANNLPWPPAGFPFEVEEWEAEHLTRSGRAVYVDPPPESAPAVPAPGRAPGPAATPGQQGLAPETVPVPDPVPGPPKPSDGKQAWVEWAVSQGEKPETARRMALADLQSKYGGRM